MFDDLIHDLRYSLRLLRRQPLFTATAALSLAVGIGANTAIFTVANALLLRPPAGVADPERLVDIGRTQNGSGFDNSSYPNYVDVRQRTTAFEGVYAYRLGPTPLSMLVGAGGQGAERVFGATVSANYFTVIGARPHLGRFFTADDGEVPGERALTVLGYRLWTRRFNADPGIVGQSITLNGRPFLVAGVAQEGFHGTNMLTADLWVPMAMAAVVEPRGGATLLTNRAGVWLLMGARLKPGVSIAQAQDDTARLGRSLEQEYPRENDGKGLKVMAIAPVPGDGVSGVRAFMALLFAIVALVLIIACVNLAGVLLARAATRRREIAVRLAVGAGRGRLVRQLLTESMVLFVLGGVAGLALARAMTSLLLSLVPALPVPVDVSLALDVRSVIFTVALSFVAAIGCGVVPALHAARADVVPALKDDSLSGAGRLRLRNAFVVSQIAFSLLLVVAGGLFFRALQRAGSIDPGFDPGNLELTSLDLSIAGYDEARGRPLVQQVLERVRAIGGVEAAATASILPLGGGGMSLGPLFVPGRTGPDGQPEAIEADWNVVEPGYFNAMKLRLTAGRDFDDTDRAGGPLTVIVNETAAARLWPGQDPLGKELQHALGPETGQFERMTVIGVARDFKYRSLTDRARSFVFVSARQKYMPRVTIVARTAEGRRVQGDIRGVIAGLDPNLPIVQAQSFDDYAAFQLVPQRVAAWVSGGLGAVGLLLAAIGIYGVTAYMVASRTREIGVRIALGAERGDVVRMVLRQGMSLTVIGGAIGLALAAVASRLLGALLLGIPSLDPVTFGGAVILFAVTGLVACYVPARRATAIDAITALRNE